MKANPHEIEGSSVGQPQVKWRKERILGGWRAGKRVNFRHADNASPPGTAPTLALGAEKSPTDKGQAF
jgi:hypothetical protein